MIGDQYMTDVAGGRTWAALPVHGQAAHAGARDLPHLGSGSPQRLENGDLTMLPGTPEDAGATLTPEHRAASRAPRGGRTQALVRLRRHDTPLLDPLRRHAC